MELAELRFLRSQEAQERTAKSKIRRQFEVEKKELLKALRVHYEPPATVTEAIKQGVETRDFVDEAINAQIEAWKELAERIIYLGAQAGYSTFQADFDEAVSFSIFDKKAAKFAERQAGEKVVQITETNKKGVKKILKKAIEEGHSTAKTAAAISELYDGYKGVRAETIARTETSNAINWGSFNTAVETERKTDLRFNKRWVATIDSRTRGAHLQENFDKAIPLYEKFKLEDPVKGTAFYLDHPGDPHGHPSQVINCRCTLAYLAVN
jgi:uncharacterized protein with gpF-like domain